MSLTEFVGSLWSMAACRFFLSSRWRGRPPFLPRARAAARPARVRSRMMSRSNSARAPKTWKMSFPPLVVVSMASCKLWKPTPRSRRSVTVSMRCLSDRAEPIELPDHERIAGPQVGQGLLQAGPLGLGPAGLVGVDLLAPRGLQGVFLEVEVLIEGRDPGVADPHRTGPPAVSPLAAGASLTNPVVSGVGCGPL